MGIQLNIKNVEAHRLATELASLTGENLTTAVTTALRDRLDRERRERAQREDDRKALVERLLAIGRECRAHLDPGTRSEDHNDLYDENGLPH